MRDETKQYKKKVKGKPSIFVKLMVSYIVFSFLAILGLLLCAIVSLYVTTGFRQDSLLKLEFENDNTISNIDMITNIGGWVEKLNDNLEVTEVFGEKQTKEMWYTDRQLLNITSMKHTDRELERGYYVYWKEYGDSYYLIFHPQKAYSIIYNFDAQSIFVSNIGRGAFIAMALILFLDILGVSIYISNRIRKPLKNLIVGMQKIEQGQQGGVIEITSEKEFEEIQDAFNHMVVRLNDEKKENERLRNNRHKMLLELSHDIKTPVAIIKSSAHALLEGMVEKSQLMKYYEIIAMKAERVNTLSDDLFTMLKMESADYEMKPQVFDLSELLRQICAGQYMEITEAGFDFIIDIPEREVLVEGDEKLLMRVVENLLRNAAKYNQTGHKISLSLTEQSSLLQILVWDDGKKIEEEISNTMFQAFARGELTRSSKGGTGLGLAIAKAIISKHKGNIEYYYANDRNYFCITLAKVER